MPQPGRKPTAKEQAAITALLAERTKTMSTWGICYWTLGADHAVTQGHQARIVEIGRQIQVAQAMSLGVLIAPQA